jgi:hypothetical protein
VRVAPQGQTCVRGDSGGRRGCIRCIFAFAHNATNNITKKNNAYIYISDLKRKGRGCLARVCRAGFGSCAAAACCQRLQEAPSAAARGSWLSQPPRCVRLIHPRPTRPPPPRPTPLPPMARPLSSRTVLHLVTLFSVAALSPKKSHRLSHSQPPLHLPLLQRLMAEYGESTVVYMR